MRALTAVASAKAGVQVQEPLQICIENRSKSKKCDNLSRSIGKQLTHIVRVMGWCQILLTFVKNFLAFRLLSPNFHDSLIAITPPIVKAVPSTICFAPSKAEVSC
jgi:hypothetical protein